MLAYPFRVCLISLFFSPLCIAGMDGLYAWPTLRFEYGGKPRLWSMFVIHGVLLVLVVISAPLSPACSALLPSLFLFTGKVCRVAIPSCVLHGPEATTEAQQLIGKRQLEKVFPQFRLLP